MAGYSFDPNAPDGTEVTLDNGVTFETIDEPEESKVEE